MIEKYNSSKMQWKEAYVQEFLEKIQSDSYLLKLIDGECSWQYKYQGDDGIICGIYPCDNASYFGKPVLYITDPRCKITCEFYPHEYNENEVVLKILELLKLK